MKTLIADDEFASRTIAQRLLGRLGPCDAVTNGADAVQAFERAWQQNRPYNLICLDILMPDMDGQEALVRIREIEKAKEIRDPLKVKVIMVTALDHPQSVMTAIYQGGATAYLVKPIRERQLMSELFQLGLVAQTEVTPSGTPCLRTITG